MAMTSNTAAWLRTPKTYPFEVGSAPLSTPSENEILVRNHAVAMNLIDSMVQKTAFHPVDCPAILGQDLAVIRFKQGDRVVGNSVIFGSEKARDGAFQTYTVLRTNMASEIPDDISFEAAAVLPLALSTAACALFQKEDLNLQLPSEPAQKITGKTLLVWGGSSRVSSNSIQLAVAAGRGAVEVSDHRSPTIVADVIGALKGKELVGAFDCIGGDATGTTVGVVQKCEGNRFVVTTKRVPSDILDGVIVKHIRGDGLRNHSLGKAIYEDFLPKALRARPFVSAPDPLVVGKGLEHIQEALDICQKGVSARKVVVLL